MHYEKLFEKGTIGRLELRNRVVMTAMGTMLGDWNGCSTPEQVRFYEERAKGGCGLIIPEFTSVDPDSGHCNRIQLGIWDARQIASFERICDAVHRHGAKIFVQLHHGGREAPPAINGGRQAMAPSVELNSVIGRDTILPREMTIEDIDRLVGLFIQAAPNAQAAGADGVEIHGAHGYLLQQFLSPYTNKRTDEYGGSVENRQRFLLETIDAVAEAVGNSHVAVRLSPFGRIYDLAPYEGEEQTWSAITDALGQRELAYVHLYYQPVYTKAPLPEGFRRRFRNTFKGTIIAAGGFTRDIAEQALEDDELDLVAFGVPYIANPDLVERMQNGWPLAESDRATYYGVSGSPEKGYTDYPVWQAQ